MGASRRLKREQAKKTHSIIKNHCPGHQILFSSQACPMCYYEEWIIQIAGQLEETLTKLDRCSNRVAR